MTPRDRKAATRSCAAGRGSASAPRGPPRTRTVLWSAGRRFGFDRRPSPGREHQVLGHPYLGPGPLRRLPLLVLFEHIHGDLGQEIFRRDRWVLVPANRSSPSTRWSESFTGVSPPPGRSRTTEAPAAHHGVARGARPGRTADTTGRPQRPPAVGAPLPESAAGTPSAPSAPA